MKLPEDKTVQLTVFSLPAHLPVVRAATERMCQLIGFDADAAGKIVLSVDEAMTNIIKHAYQGADDKPIEIHLTPIRHRGRKGLRICLRDYGRVVDRSRIRSRDLADVRPGGLGVHIMSECMDQVDYRAAEGGGTLLTMLKLLASPEEGKSE